MDTVAVLLRNPEHLELGKVALTPPGAGDVVVAVEWSGISTGTERLLYQGRMPPFPGMGYPLVPGYESVGRIAAVGAESGRQVGEPVFVAGARCFTEVRGLFGGAAARLVVPAAKAIRIGETLGQQGILLSLAATAVHALAGQAAPELVIGHGVLGRLLARVTLALGHPAPLVWEVNPARRDGALGYQVVSPEDDTRRDYRCIHDVSGDPTLLDSLIARLARGGEVVLAGFYAAPLSFSFPPAFMREARLRIAAEFTAADMAEAQRLLQAGLLNLDGLLTHTRPAAEAPDAYRTAFTDPACLKMVLNWSACA